ncbi:hypothetical protein BB559_000540 [Furculomyces boomerangus]|uniref:Mannosyltransferase n=1 Tax=Furculomyces boomerangus TaxID=61424 RepID=A0A2T9Z510_9FUNG|nr:hypothetical protein BB559_000540 [Furculomyces boomerangus]
MSKFKTVFYVAAIALTLVLNITILIKLRASSKNNLNTKLQSKEINLLLDNKNNLNDKDKQDMVFKNADGFGKSPLEIQIDEHFVDYTKLSLNFTRVENWPTKFPENLTEYRETILKTQYLTKQNQWKEEIAPWVWHHRGVAEDKYIGKTDTREKAAILVLVRNSELEDIKHSIRMLEDRFNRRYNYPYIFLNDKPFSNKFMEHVARSTKSNTTFALIPQEHWEVPDSIDMEKTKVEFEKLVSQDIVYGGSLSYRQMCRFNSGFFYKHPLVQNLKYYWRLEPNIDFYCDIDYDPFKFMRENKKIYSFVIILYELKKTIPTLWKTSLEYAKQNNITSNLLKLFVNENKDYNLCHFWSNFEIASLDWYRSKEYESYFQFLDSTGSFFYERWGDAPIHSLAAGLFLNKDQIHFFNDIGYRHDQFARWPVSTTTNEFGIKCQVPKNIKENFDVASGECLNFWNTYKPYEWTNLDSTDALNTLYMNRFKAANDDTNVITINRWREMIVNN